MRQAQGYTIITGPDPGTGERDTFTCAHCNRVVVVKPMMRAEDMGGICHLCGDKHRPAFVCALCVGKSCDPFEEKLKRIEKYGKLR